MGQDGQGGAARGPARPKTCIQNDATKGIKYDPRKTAQGPDVIITGGVCIAPATVRVLPRPVSLAVPQLKTKTAEPYFSDTGAMMV